MRFMGHWVLHLRVMAHTTSPARHPQHDHHPRCPAQNASAPPTENQAQYCIGLIQPADAQLTNPASSIGDMILSVPFLRNIYTVMAYTLPNPDGSLPVFDPANQTDGGLSQTIRPRLDVLPLMNPTKALQEFNTMRVLNKPISSATPTPNTGSSGSMRTVDVGGRSSRSVSSSSSASCRSLHCVVGCLRSGGSSSGGSSAMQPWMMTALRWIRRRRIIWRGAQGDAVQCISEEEKRGLSDGTMDSDRTLNVGYDTGKGEGGADGYKDEFGLVRSRASGVANDEGVWDPQTGLVWGDDTLVGGGQRQKGAGVTRDEHPGPEVPLVADQDRITPPSSPEQAAFRQHRNYSDPKPALRPHKNMASVDIPLLPVQRYEEQSDDDHSPSRFSAQPSHHARLFSLDQEPQHPPQASSAS
ncbi:hypothetical protein BDZ97DRAFT_822214 [Flammula alnicola]|nr:hypothetical protein BDZ97DRAFT_822214 [Flammula alnicola]